MQTDNMELKKLVYLYLMNYAKSHPDLTIMAVNTFQKVCDVFLRAHQVKSEARTPPPFNIHYVLWTKKLKSLPFWLQDCHDPSPLIRALAVRTMGCVRVDKITEYLCDPLRKCLRVCAMLWL